ncbi:MAG: selenium metabolism-associated LysR family transcriptional regulator [Bacillota bacterium]|nr:selenium metabolism-associated LysR family transcriptional regulator [Bacillota bacterium]
MDFGQLRAFINVVSLKSFSGAADKLYISQPSVSIRIKNLEQELGFALFDRSKAREPVLTEIGQLFLDYAQAVINLEDEFKNKLSARNEEAAGMVRVGASTVPGTYLLPSILAGFKKSCPAIEFKINILDTGAVLEGIQSYDYDLGFVGSRKEDEKVDYLPLIEDELVLCTPRALFNDPAYKESGIPLDNIISKDLLMREQGSATRQFWEKKLAEKELQLDDFLSVTYFNSLEGIKQAVIAGLGITVMSRMSVTDAAASGKIELYRIRDLDMHRLLYLVCHRRRIHSLAVCLFRNYIVDKYRCEK